MPKVAIEQAVILAAGRGTRLWPYGDTQPKAALPIGNRPLIHRQFEALSEAGFRKVAVVANHLEGCVRAAVEDWSLTNKSLSVEVVIDPAPKGTARSAVLGLGALNAGQPTLLVPGDLLFHADDLKAGVGKFDGKSVLAWIAPLIASHVQEGIRAEVEKGHVTAISAHSRYVTPNGWRLTGLAAIPKGFIDALESTPDLPTCVEIGGMPAPGREVFETFHRYVKAGGAIQSHETKEEVIDIDRPWDFLHANSVLTDWETRGLKKNVLAKGASIHPSARVEGAVKLGQGSSIGPGVILYGNAVIGDRTVVTDGAYVGSNVLIGDECKVWRGCLVGDHTVIGHRCVVGHGAEVEGLMLEESYSYHYGEFWGVMGKCCDLGAATVCGTLRFDDGQSVHRVKGRKEQPRYHANATYLGDYVRTGVNAILMPGVKVGAYSLIGAGVLLQEDVPNNTSIFLDQTLTKGTWGPERYGW